MCRSWSWIGPRPGCCRRLLCPRRGPRGSSAAACRGAGRSNGVRTGRGAESCRNHNRGLELLTSYGELTGGSRGRQRGANLPGCSRVTCPFKTKSHCHWGSHRMSLGLRELTSDHRTLVTAAAQAAGIDDPVVVQLEELQNVILGHARRGRFVAIDGVFVRTWDRNYPKYWPGMNFGLRLYTLDNIRLARCVTQYSDDLHNYVHNFFIVARADYLPLFRKAIRLRRRSAPTDPPPILPPELFDTLRRNSLGYLNRDNLQRIRSLGGRPRRGLLLSGPPGNGKTSACRWLWEECHRLRLQYRIVSPDDFRAARQSCNPGEAVKQLFTVSKPGIVFFDDMDIALRDRALSPDKDDQNVFLGAMDGI